MESVTKAVEKNIGAVLPDKFGAILDDWTHGTEHHMANNLEQVQSLMQRLRTITQASKLRLKTSLRPKLRNETCWGSTYSILARYFELREFISKDDEELAEEMPAPAANRQLKALLAQWGVLEIQPSFANYLAPRADIATRPTLTVFAGGEHGGGVTGEAEPTKIGFADRMMKRRKVEVATSAYGLLEIIPPTSNIVERLFSVAPMVLRYEKNRITPLTLKMILFVKMNDSYGDVTTVDA
ncbi:hypothetical protein PHMEG_00030031 [Phytophthora megakarya]|uniref:HAT C-terminal dimerisation domain-containing protein n=1 Tax=Phytophthora megakarya TaxID=4795 RepID=A0A225V193_9STRA|nr:hypothetical protein PHMEG_00030031 [Phytophthora megakarya]